MNNTLSITEYNLLDYSLKLQEAVEKGYRVSDFIVANIVAGKSWVGDFLDPDSEQIYNKFIGRREGYVS